MIGDELNYGNEYNQNVKLGDVSMNIYKYTYNLDGMAAIKADVKEVENGYEYYDEDEEETCVCHKDSLNRYSEYYSNGVIISVTYISLKDDVDIDKITAPFIEYYNKKIKAYKEARSIVIDFINSIENKESSI